VEQFIGYADVEIGPYIGKGKIKGKGDIYHGRDNQYGI
jgi:hypothetical protein